MSDFKTSELRDTSQELQELRAQLKEAQEAAEFNFKQYQDAGRLLFEAQANLERLKGNNNAGLDTNPNNTESKQQRELVSAVEMGQLLERGKDKKASSPPTQGVIVLAGVDEYGPLLHWHTHWVDFEDGSEFYSEQQLAASQAREVLLREALQELHYACKCDGSWENCGVMDDAREALAIPTDTTALEALITKAGYVVVTKAKQACIDLGAKGIDSFNYTSFVEAIDNLPTIKLEDLK